MVRRGNRTSMRSKFQQFVLRHVHHSSRVVLTLALSAPVLACGSGSSSETVASASLDVPPLPPSTDTSIAVLVSHSEQLGLSEQQSTALAEMESDLEARNEPLKAKLQEMQTAPKRSKAPDGQARTRGGGGKGMSGGRGGGGGRGGRGGPPPRSGKSGPDVAANRDRNRKRGERAQQIRAEMVSNNAASLEQAFGLLSDSQKDQAVMILEKEGHEAPQLLEPQSPEPQSPEPQLLDATSSSQP